MLELDPGASHGVINGRTRSGKTFMFRKKVWSDTRRRGVFLNTQRERGFGPEVTRWDARLLAKPRSRVNLVGPVPVARADGDRDLDPMLDLAAQVVNDLIAIGDSATRGLDDDEDTECEVIVGADEAHLLAPKSVPTDNPLSLASTNGARYGFRLWGITQRPALYSHTCLSQATTHVLFDLDDYEAPYLDEYAVPEWVREYVSATPPGKPPGTPNRRFAMRQGKTWTPCLPVT